MTRPNIAYLKSLAEKVNATLTNDTIVCRQWGDMFAVDKLTADKTSVEEALHTGKAADTKDFLKGMIARHKLS